MPMTKSHAKSVIGLVLFAASAYCLVYERRTWAFCWGTVAAAVGVRGVVRRQITLSDRARQKTTYQGVSAVMYSLAIFGLGVACLAIGYYWEAMAPELKLE